MTQTTEKIRVTCKNKFDAACIGSFLFYMSMIVISAISIVYFWLAPSTFEIITFQTWGTCGAIFFIATAVKRLKEILK